MSEMGKLSDKLRSVAATDGKRIAYYCPGCKHPHVIKIEGTGKPCWQWDGDVNVPTISPSVLSRVYFPPEDGGPEVCHHFLKGGILQFLNDSTHELSGQSVTLPDWPEGVW